MPFIEFLVTEDRAPDVALYLAHHNGNDIIRAIPHDLGYMFQILTDKKDGDFVNFAIHVGHALGRANSNIECLETSAK